MKDLFRKIAAKISNAAGSATTFLIAITVVVIWALSGSAFNYSNTWQLFINTGTTIVTFLMVFLIQNTQNRDSKALHLKLDELIRASKADDSFVDLEDLSDDELAQLDKEFRELREKQSGSPAMLKLHKKVVEEHEHRSSRYHPVRAVSNMISSINKNLEK